MGILLLAEYSHCGNLMGKVKHFTWFKKQKNQTNTKHDYSSLLYLYTQGLNMTEVASVTVSKTHYILQTINFTVQKEIPLAYIKPPIPSLSSF